MRKKIKVWTIITIGGLVLESWALYMVGSSPARWRSSMIVKDDPAAHDLYDKMIEMMRQTESLSYTSVCSGPDYRESVYRIWLKKPGYFRIETSNPPSRMNSIFVGDGDHLWFFWQGTRPFSAHEDWESYKKTRSKVYIKKAIPTGKYSIRDQINLSETAWYGIILDPSTFLGQTDSLENYIDGIRSRGTDYVDDEECEIIEVSFMKAQLTRYFWISRQDHLLLKIKEITRLADNKVQVEEFSDMSFKARIPQQKFIFSPPDGWQQWDKPGRDDILLKPGTEAPDFELLSADGGKIKLSDYRGKAVWLYIWQCGSPACRKSIPHLQKLFEKHKDKGLMILGFNCADDKKIARIFMRENSVTFPSILDSSDTAEKVVSKDYKNRNGFVPLSYIIDIQGYIADTWYGYDEDHKRTSAALKKTGIQLE
jgi:peroxiredoxin/outer membrane lipoprotein-sorting protein